MHAFRWVCAVIFIVTMALVMRRSGERVHAAQAVDLDRALGNWLSAEQFEGEPRVQVGFRRQGNEIVGWVVMLGQQRKDNNRVVLALSFCGARWDRDRVRFEAVLPDDEGTLGWEMRPTGNGTGVLSAVTENGSALPAPLVWDVRR